MNPIDEIMELSNGTISMRSVEQVQKIFHLFNLQTQEKIILTSFRPKGIPVVKACLPLINPNEQKLSELSEEAILRMKSLEMLKVLLQFGAKLTNTSISTAIDSRNYEIVQFIFSEVNPSIYLYHSLLMRSASQGSIEIFNFFSNKMFGDAQEPKTIIQECFENAIRGGISQMEIIKYLVEEKDANFNHVNGNWTTPLWITAQRRQFEIAKYLIDQKGLKLNQVENDDGKTPLWISCYQGSFDLSKLLIEKEFLDLNKADHEYSETPLFKAANGGHFEILKLLVEQKHRIDLNKANFEGKTPLFVACHFNHLRIAKYLIDQKETIDLNKANDREETPIYISCMNGNLELVKYLVDNGASLSYVSHLKNVEKNPIWVAAFENQLEILKFLVEKCQMDCINLSSNNEGESLVSIVSKLGHSKIETYLTEKQTSKRQQEFDNNEEKHKKKQKLQ